MLENVFFFLKTKNNVKYLYDNISVKDGLALMRKHKYTAMPIINKEGYYVGTISEGDFLWYFMDHPTMTQEDLEHMEIKELVRDDFTPPVKIDVPISQLFEQSLKQNFVPVVDDRHIFIGIVTRQSIIQYLMNHTDKQKPETNTIQSNSLGLIL